jgi:hypothetical protein
MGVVFTGTGVSALLSGGSTLVGGLMTLGGVGMVLVAGFEVVTSEPSGSSLLDVWRSGRRPSARSPWSLVGLSGSLGRCSEPGPDEL